MMTSAQVVETSVTVTDNSPFQDNPHPDDVTPGFKPFREGTFFIGGEGGASEGRVIGNFFTNWGGGGIKPDFFFRNRGRVTDIFWQGKNYSMFLS